MTSYHVCLRPQFLTRDSSVPDIDWEPPWTSVTAFNSEPPASSYKAFEIPDHPKLNSYSSHVLYQAILMLAIPALPITGVWAPLFAG